MFIDWALAAPTVNTLGEYSSYDGTGIHDQKPLARQTSDKNLCQSAQRADDDAQLRVGHVVVLGQNNLIFLLSLKRYGRQVQSPTDTHQIIH